MRSNFASLAPTGAKVTIGLGVGIVILLLVFKDPINGH
jgi:hypothetical protein